MASRPTTVSKLESKLCKSGYASDGVLSLNPDASDDGHEWYPEAMTLVLGGTSVDFSERYSEDKVELRTTLTPEQLVRVAQAFSDTHGSKQNGIRVSAIVTVTTAVAVCDAIGS